MKIIFNLQNDISLLDKRGDSLKGLRDEFAVQAIGVSFVFIYLFIYIHLFNNDSSYLCLVILQKCHCIVFLTGINNKGPDNK